MLTRTKPGVFMVVLPLCLLTGMVFGNEAEHSDDPAPVELPPVIQDVQATVVLKKFSSRDVEVRLRDGSRLRGEIGAIEHLAVKTEFGELKVPIAELRRVSRGDRLSAAEARELMGIIKELDHEEYENRRVAQKKIESYGHRALELLTDALASAPPERRARLQESLKRVAAKCGRRPPMLDVIRTSQVDIRGRMELGKIPVKTRFGLLDFAFEDLDCIRWLAYGERQEYTLDAWKSISEWTDTGLEVSEGDELAISASGQMNCGGNVMQPSGSSAWGNTAPFQVGTLIAKIGENGKPFAVNEGVKCVAPIGDRVYLRVWVQQNMLGRSNQASYSGEYQVTVATGAQVPGVKIAAQE